MRYNLRAVMTQTRDLETALLFNADESSYLFSCPDIFQRIAASQKIRFNKVTHFFLPALGPDYTAGFMGFYQSAKGSVVDMDTWNICLVGPRGLHELVRSWDFAFRNLTVIELPDNLGAPLPAEDEESKGGEGEASKPLFKL